MGGGGGWTGDNGPDILARYRTGDLHASSFLTVRLSPHDVQAQQWRGHAEEEEERLNNMSRGEQNRQVGLLPKPPAAVEEKKHIQKEG